MTSKITFVFLACTVAVAVAQSPSSSFPRGKSLQAWQDPGLPAVLAKCKQPPKPFSIPTPPASAQSAPAAPPEPQMPGPTTAIPGVVAAGQQWKVVWSWEGKG